MGMAMGSVHTVTGMIELREEFEARLPRREKRLWTSSKIW